MEKEFERIPSLRLKQRRITRRRSDSVVPEKLCDRIACQPRRGKARASSKCGLLCRRKCRISAEPPGAYEDDVALSEFNSFTTSYVVHHVAGNRVVTEGIV